MVGAQEAISAELEALLKPSGLVPRGWFQLEARDIPQAGAGVRPGMAALLVGNFGPAMWQAFSRSVEFEGDIGDPLDRWTARVVHSALGQIDDDSVALYPFGDPVWPFQRFAARALGIGTSPLGILIHPSFGLWHALRAAIVFPELKVQPEPVHKSIHPCDSCIEKPCLSACPVNAFTGRGFAVEACRSYLDSTSSSDSDSRSGRRSGGEGPDCMETGCAARNACPVGAAYRYPPRQIEFHMRAFRGG